MATIHCERNLPAGQLLAVAELDPGLSDHDGSVPIYQNSQPSWSQSRFRFRFDLEGSQTAPEAPQGPEPLRSYECGNHGGRSVD